MNDHCTSCHETFTETEAIMHASGEDECPYCHERNCLICGDSCAACDRFKKGGQMKTCPKCGSKRVIMFDADNDLCQNCGKWFPAVAAAYKPGNRPDACECQDWARESIYPLTEHHPNCPHYNLEKDAVEVINKLLDGIIAWASDEDGVHPECFAAFQRAAYFVGRSEVVKEGGESPRLGIPVNMRMYEDD